MIEPWAILMPEAKAGYVEIAKVASSSIKVFIATTLGIPLQDGDPHATDFPTALLVDVPSDYFVFSFARNPWDRLVSCYRDKLGGEPGEFTDLEGRGIAACLSTVPQFSPDMPFADFVAAVAQIPDDDADEHFRSQYTFITDRLDFLGRFEHLETDFSHVLSRLGLHGHLDHRQASPRHLDFRRFYTPATSQAVAQRYAEDLDRFDYRDNAP